RGRNTGTATIPGTGAGGLGETSKAGRGKTGTAGTDEARTGGTQGPADKAVPGGTPATPPTGTNGTRATRTPATRPARPIGTVMTGRPTGSAASHRPPALAPGPSALTVLAEAVRSPQRGGAGMPDQGHGVVVGLDNGGTTNNATVLDSAGRFLVDHMLETH